MKAIQTTFDEQLLEKLDGDTQVKRYGRSAVRRAVAESLRKKRRARLLRRIGGGMGNSLLNPISVGGQMRP